ncbi:recombination protein NinB [Yersinia enterocolitica]
MDKQKYLLLNESIRNNAIAAIRNTPLDFKSPKEVIIQESKRSLPQNARLATPMHHCSRCCLKRKVFLMLMFGQIVKP